MQTIAKTLAELLNDVVDVVIHQGYKAKRVTIKVGFSDFQTLARRETISECSGSKVDRVEPAGAADRREGHQPRKSWS